MIQLVYCLCSLMNVIVMFALVRSVGNKVYCYYNILLNENVSSKKKGEVESYYAAVK